MAELKGKMTLDMSGVDQAVQKSVKELQDFDKAVSKLGNSNSFQKLGIPLEQLKRDIGENSKAFQQFANDMGRNSNTVKQQIAQMRNAMANLRANGVDELSASYRTMQQELGRLMDIQGDVAASGKVWANDMAQMLGVLQGVNALTAGYGALQSSMLLMGIENENAAEGMRKLMAATTLLNSVNQIANAFNKDSYLMLTIIKPIREAYNAAIQKNTALEAANNAVTAANTGLQTGNAGATGRATIATAANAVKTTVASGAQKAYNVALAIGEALMGNWGALVLAGVAGVGAYALSTSAAASAQEEMNEKMKEGEGVANSYESALELVKAGQDKIQNSAADVYAEYEVLRKQWAALSTEQEKAAWLEANRSKFASMGLSINDVNDAERIFVKDTGRVVAALKARAEAQAIAEVMKDNYKELYRLQSEFSKLNAEFKYNADNSDELLDKMKRIGAAETALEQENEKLGKSYQTLTKEYQGVLGSSTLSTPNYKGGGRTGGRAGGGRTGGHTGGRTGGSTGSGTDKPTYENGSVADYDTQISEINKKLKNQKLTQEQINKLIKERTELEVDRNELLRLQNQQKPSAIPSLSSAKLEGTVPVDLKIDTRALDEVKQKTDVWLESIANVKEELRLLMGGEIVDFAKKFQEMWDNADGPEKWVMGLGAMSLVTDTLAQGLDAAAQSNEQFATAAKAAQIAAKSFAAAEATLAAVEAIKEGAKMPFPSNIVAIGMASASVMAALFNVMGAFATGGIVGGTDYTGDRRTVRVNSGEMILNQRLQRNLFNAINNNTLGGSVGQVQFRLRGQELVGLINNYSTKRGRSL